VFGLFCLSDLRLAQAALMLLAEPPVLTQVCHSGAHVRTHVGRSADARRCGCG
jgi:hypothetical protein